MSSLLPFLISGIVTGALYGLAGMGLVLTYRTSGVFNFGHGAIAAGGAYLFYTLHVEHGLAWPLAGIATLAVFGLVVGLILERLTRGLANVPEVFIIVATVGVLLATQGILFVLYGSETRNFPEFLPSSGFKAGGVFITWSQVISFSVAVVAAILVYGFLRASRLGIAMRAVVDNPRLVGLTGERPARVRQAAWSIGSAFAALSGILLAPTLGLDATLLTLLVVQAFGACAIGLFRSLPLTFAGGLAVGVLAALSTKYLTSPALVGVPSSVPFIVLLAVLLVAPRSKLPQRSSAIPGLVVSVRRTSRTSTAGIAVVAAALVAVPFVVGTKLPVWTSFLVYVLIFASLSLLVWTSGQISLCHMSFVALGATTMAHLNPGVPWLLAVLLAGLATVPLGVVLALPAIRLSGIYLAIATLGFAILMQQVVFPTNVMFGSGLIATASRPDFGPIDPTSDRSLYFVILAVATLCCLALVAITRRRLGRLLRGLAESPTMLGTHGLPTNVTRLIAFCIAAFFAGVGGALAVTQSGSVSGVTFGPIPSLLLVAVLAIAGTRPLLSPLLSAALLALMPAYFTQLDSDRQILFFGAVAVTASVVLAKRSEIRDWIASAAARSEGRRERGRLTDRRPRQSDEPLLALSDAEAYAR